MKKKLLALLLFFPFYVFSQTQERTVLIYNIGFGAFTSGVGAVINKPKHANWGKYFLKGCWQGSVGGLLHYAGKKTLYLITTKNNVAYGWPAKILHAAGSSIVENAALNEPFLQNWNIDYGPARFDFSTNGKRPFQIRFLPEFVYSIIATATLLDGQIKKVSLDYPTTLLSGCFAFKGINGVYVGRTNLEGGVTYGRSFAYSEYPTLLNFKYQAIAHEYVHIFQYSEYQVFNTWLRPAYTKLRSNNTKKILDKYVYPDVPYFLLPYGIGKVTSTKNYYSNFFEFEAERFTTNHYIQR